MDFSLPGLGFHERASLSYDGVQKTLSSFEAIRVHSYTSPDAYKFAVAERDYLARPTQILVHTYLIDPSEHMDTNTPRNFKEIRQLSTVIYFNTSSNRVQSIITTFNDRWVWDIQREADGSYILFGNYPEGTVHSQRYNEVRILRDGSLVTQISLGQKFVVDKGSSRALRDSIGDYE